MGRGIDAERRLKLRLPGAWLARLGDPYKFAGADTEGRAGLDWGLSGVPETYLVDGQGIVRRHYRGPITERDLNETILPFLKAAK